MADELSDADLDAHVPEGSFITIGNQLNDTIIGSVSMNDAITITGPYAYGNNATITVDEVRTSRLVSITSPYNLTGPTTRASSQENSKSSEQVSVTGGTAFSKPRPWAVTGIGLSESMSKPFSIGIDELIGMRERMVTLEHEITALKLRVVTLECTPPGVGGPEYQRALKEELESGLLKQ
jgi:hypothetical protein